MAGVWRHLPASWHVSVSLLLRPHGDAAMVGTDSVELGFAVGPKKWVEERPLPASCLPLQLLQRLCLEVRKAWRE